MEAIHLLQTLEKEERLATPEEQEILSRYVGWGGIPQAFEESNSSWANEYLELKNTLSPEEYSAARASTLNAFYTSPIVIRSMYEEEVKRLDAYCHSTTASVKKLKRSKTICPIYFYLILSRYSR